MVKHRLYGLITVFISVMGTGPAASSAVFDALRAAVHNSDDLAVALILKGLADADASRAAASTAVAAAGDAAGAVAVRGARFAEDLTVRLPLLIALAASLRHDQIRRRLQLALEAITTSSLQVFNEYAPYHRTPVREASVFLAESVDIAFDSSGFSPFTLGPVVEDRQSAVAVEPVSSSASSLSTSTSTITSTLNLCAIERVDIAHMSEERFFRDYVSVNQPVVLTTAAARAVTSSGGGIESGSGSGESLVNIWHLDALVQKFGHVKEVASTIPYATLFGHKEV